MPCCFVVFTFLRVNLTRVSGKFLKKRGNIKALYVGGLTVFPLQRDSGEMGLLLDLALLQLPAQTLRGLFREETNRLTSYYRHKQRMALF